MWCSVPLPRQGALIIAREILSKYFMLILDVYFSSSSDAANHNSEHTNTSPKTKQKTIHCPQSAYQTMSEIIITNFLIMILAPRSCGSYLCPAKLIEEVTMDMANTWASPAGTGSAAVSVNQELISAVPLHNPTVSPLKSNCLLQLPTSSCFIFTVHWGEKSAVFKSLCEPLKGVRAAIFDIEILPNKEAGVPEVMPWRGWLKERMFLSH